MIGNNDIRQLIGEATEYDKKQALEVKKPKSWCKSVSAFANGIGGKLVWGIADDDTLVGLADASVRSCGQRKCSGKYVETQRIGAKGV
jgi:ATP-dependent DNA helicase RecG